MTDGTPRRLRWVFDEVAELYDRVRPTYPAELFSDLADVTGFDVGSAVLEVGCGTGQATTSLAALGWSVTAVEPGVHLAALARRHMADSPGVVIEVASFEEWDRWDRRFDAVVGSVVVALGRSGGRLASRP